MNRVRAAAAIHLQDKFSWFFLPWIVVGFSFVVNLLISYLLVEGTMYTGGMISIHIFMLVAGVVAMTSTFPFAIGFSVRRTDYILGTYSVFVGISLLSGIVLWLMGFIEQSTNSWGSDLHFFHLPYISDGSAAEQIAFQASMVLFFLLLGFLPAAVHRRIGMSGMLLTFVGLSLLLTIAGYTLDALGYWPDIWAFLAKLQAIDIAGILLALSAVFAAVGYLLIRRAAIR